MSTLKLDLVSGGKPDYTLLATCAGDGSTGGGLFAFDGATLQVIDRVSSAGLRVAGDRIIRLLRAPISTGGGEFVFYDARGVRQYFRLDELSDGHFFAWDGGHIVLASTGTNSVLWVSLSGAVDRVWRIPGDGDSCHLNEVVLHDNRLFVCVFGQYGDYRGYKGRERSGDGYVFDLETGEKVVRGLCAPHSPRYFDGAWAVCNSMRNEFVQFESDGLTPKRTALLDGFTRGVAVSDGYIFVGESDRRASANGGKAGSIAVLSRSTFEKVARIPLPFEEISDLTLVPSELVEGTRAGFRTNPLRVHEQDQLFLFHQLGLEPKRIWATSDPLPPEQCRASVSAAIPNSFELGKLALIDCTVQNLGECFYSTGISNPVSLSYKWLRTEQSPPMDHQEGRRTALPCVLPPQGKLDLRMEVMPPPIPGEFRFIVTLVQDGVCWFDEIDPANACSAVVVVRERQHTQTPDSSAHPPAYLAPRKN
jgi:acetolactate synthase-1/2/3 large subunit